MSGRVYLPIARELYHGATEGHWRAAASRAYYALLLEARDALARWGFAVPPRHQVHAFVRLRCNYATDPDLKTIGAVLDSLSRLRNQADYDWTTPGPFTDGSRVDQAIRKAEAALVLLDQIDADPQRRAQAVAAIRRAFP